MDWEHKGVGVWVERSLLELIINWRSVWISGMYCEKDETGSKSKGRPQNGMDGLITRNRS